MRTRTDAESAVLGVLAPGGMLTAGQITTQAELTGWAARRAIGQLAARGLIVANAGKAQWSITARGRGELLATDQGARRGR